TLVLLKEAHVKNSLSDPKNKNAPPIEIRGDRASYAELDGIARVEGNASVLQGERTARADSITGVVNVKSRMLERVEMRANSMLKSLEKGKASEVTARDMTFYFDEMQRLKTSIAEGAARAVSLEKDSPREIYAAKIEAAYKPNENSSDLERIV